MEPVLCFAAGTLTGYAVCRLTYRHACRALAAARRANPPAPVLAPKREPLPEPEPVLLPFPRPQLRVYRGE